MKIVDESLLDVARRHAVEFLETLPDRHVGARATRDELLSALNVPLPERGDDPKAVLDSLASQAARGTVATAGPRVFGFVIGGPPPGAAAPRRVKRGGGEKARHFCPSPPPPRTPR